MSKQSEAKERQGFTKVLATCSNCEQFTFVERTGGYSLDHVFQEKLRCGLGGFAVNKNATCNKHRPKT